MSSIPPARGRHAPELALLVLLALSLVAWFGGWPTLGSSVVVAGAALLAALGCAWVALEPRPAPRLSVDAAGVVAVALAYRLPALLHPWGWVNTDGAYGAFVAMRLLSGARPAPVFTEGASYQGTLKGHLAALFALAPKGDDLSRAMVLAGLVLTLVFILATMSLARRIGGRPAAVAGGLYLALGPKFLTVFTLNSVGQYVDVLALGGMALALMPPLLEDEAGPRDALRAAGVGLLLGAAFWQQPVATCYALTVSFALLWRRGPGTAARWAWIGAGALVGVLPVLIWNVDHGWASSRWLGPDRALLRDQALSLPYLARRTADTSLPVLAGVSPGHPWLRFGGGAVRALAALLVPAALIAFLALHGRALVGSLRRGRPSAALLPPVLAAACVALVWATAAGAVYARPRYLLPLMAATAVHIGVVWGRAWSRARVPAVLALAALLALNVSGTQSRLRDGGPTEDYYRRVLVSLRAKGVRTGYADFSLAAPVTMFTRGKILLSSRLGPTPAYEPESYAARVEREGPDAYVLRPDDDPERFAAVLRALGVGYRMDLDPVPVFYGFSRRVRLEEVSGFRGDAVTGDSPAEE